MDATTKEDAVDLGGMTLELRGLLLFVPVEKWDELNEIERIQVNENEV